MNIKTTDIDIEIEKEFIGSYQSGFSAPWSGSIDSWANKHVRLTPAYRPPGSFDVARSRYMIEPFQSLNDPFIHQVNIMASPRSGKTLVGEIFMLYTIANNPSSFLWVQQTNEQMDKLGGLRMSQLLKLCEPVNDLIDTNDRFSVTKKHFKFSNDMRVILGSAKISDLQSVGYRYIVGDECWQWEEGFMSEAHARTDDFRNCSKELYISQGGVVGTEWDMEFKKGIVNEWGWVCPKCKKEQIYHWNYKRSDGKYAGLQWDSKACKNGAWDLREASKSASMVCIHCLHKISDTQENRWKMMKDGKYVITKDDGFKHIKSYRWNSLAIPQISWGSLVEEFLFARQQEDIFNTVPMEKFDQKKLAICYGEKRNQNLLEVDIEDYDINVERPNTIRFLTVDVQQTSPHFWYIIREWDKKTSDSRLITYGSTDTWNQLEDLRKKYMVSTQSTIVDSGYATQDVYTGCAKAGRWGLVGGKKKWLCYLATKGTTSPGFRHELLDKKSIWRFYTPIEIKSVNFGDDIKYKGVQGCPYVAWSTHKIKNILDGFVHGKGPKWVAKEVDDNYRRQLSSERAIAVYKNGRKDTTWEKYNPKDRNEFWDLEALQVLAAVMSGILQTERQEGVQVEEDING